MKDYQYYFICALLLLIASNTQKGKFAAVWAAMAMMFFVGTLVACATGN